MKRWKLSTRAKQAFTWLFLVLSVAFIAMLFMLKDTLNNYASKVMQDQADSDVRSTESAYVDSAYNYTKNGLSYEITFLEFGAKGCSTCRRMEAVMGEIREKHPRVNVVFVNARQPESRSLMQYYGVVAIPSQVLLNKEGSEIFRHTGYFSVDDLSKELTKN